MLESGEARSIKAVSEMEKMPTSYTERIIRLTELAPDITSAILNGKQPHGLQLKDLIKGKPLPIDWNEQRKMLGFHTE